MISPKYFHSMPAPSRAEPFERRCRTGIMAQAYGLSSGEKLEMGQESRNPASAGAQCRSLAAQGPRAVGHSTIWADGHRVRQSWGAPRVSGDPQQRGTRQLTKGVGGTRNLIVDLSSVFGGVSNK